MMLMHRALRGGNPVAGDVTAPTLSSAVGTTLSATTATVGATTNEANGTLYVVVTTSATQPSIAQIKAGQNHSGAAASYASSQSISSTGAKTFTATGLTASTAYYAHLVHTDSSANDSNRLSSSSFTTDAASSGIDQLPAGNFFVQDQAMQLVYPLANATTAASARHRKAYYDGVNSIQYRVPVGISFGAPPYYYEITAGPTGMTIGGNYGDTDYGVVTWTPSGSESGTTVTVLVTDQSGNTISATWTVTTSSSTSDFIFVDNVAGNDSTGTGTISAPFATLAHIFGSTYGASTYPGRIAYVKGSASSYSMPLYSGAGSNGINDGISMFGFNPSNKPNSILSYSTGTNPVTISMTGSRMSTIYNDLFIQGVTFDGYNSADSNYKLLWNNANRTTLHDVMWTNPGYGSVGNDNATLLFTTDQGGSNRYQYIFCKNVQEIGRPSGGGFNNYGFCSLYTAQYVLFDNCIYDGSGDAAVYLKGTCEDVCVIYCDLDLSSNGHVLSTGFQSSNRIGVYYNKVKSATGRAVYAFESNSSNVWIRRNTYYDTAVSPYSTSGGSYTIAENVIVRASGNVAYFVSPGSYTTITATTGTITLADTECHNTIASGICDSTTLLLTGATRTSYLGERGHEISAL